MLIPIKYFTVNTRIPALSDLEEAQRICFEESCEVEIWWLPNAYAGWYHLHITAKDDIYKMYEYQVPKVYGV